MTFMVVMAVEKSFHLTATWLYPVRFAATAAALLWFSRGVMPRRPASAGMSVLIGAAVFAIWIGPDVLFGPGYRQHWLFRNAVTGEPASSLPEGAHQIWFLIIRAVSCTVLVPVMEELFWRGWAMRWLIDKDFCKVRLGTYVPAVFWIVALLFASEHGAYWEVGLLAGVIYNWWIVRTRNLADCMIAHAVTNGLLSAYVLYCGQWQYWL